METLTLARLQFALNMTFHILFPAITIALCWILLFFKWRFNVTQDTKWQNAYQFWVKIFALCFAIGIVSGVTMSFQFGTNWPVFMQTVGNVAGPLLAYEVLTAFFMEATFLGIMLFGTKLVSNRIHTLATFLVAIGTTISAFWIIALNSWLQTPAGFEMRDGKAVVTDWVQVIFNPSMPYRFFHMLIASGLTASFLIAGISAYRLLYKDKKPEVMTTLKTGIYLAAILIPLQIMVGDMHGLNTLHYQPAKIAAMEGVWQTQRHVSLELFAIPNEVEKRNDYAISIPYLGSIILTHSLDGEIKGLESFGANRPKVLPVFFAFRIMVGTGLLMLATAWLGAWFLKQRKSIPSWFARWLVVMTFSGWIATLAGWYTTETGRQPWLVYNILSTAQAASPHITGGMITSTLILYILIYLFLLISFITVVFHLAYKSSVANEPPLTPVIL